MSEIELSAGTIEYQDTGGDGPVLVLLHGLMMDASLWDEVIAGLSPGHRCVAPTLPLGAHRHPMDPAADLSLPGIARLTAEFLDRLDLHDVTLVGNDTGGALVQLLMSDGNARVGRAVLVSCDAFDNFPPGLTGKTLLLSGKLPPPLFGLFMQQMRLRAVRRLPIAFGWLTKRGDVDEAGPDPARDPPRRRADASGRGRRYRLPAVGGRTAPWLRPPRSRRLGQPGPGDATRTWPAPGRAPSPGTAVRGRRQLYAHPAGPARQAGPDHQGFRR
jgi:pimeloyl-ACP methyl ester carboxylesterase